MSKGDTDLFSNKYFVSFYDDIANNTVKLKYIFSRDDILLSSKNKPLSYHLCSCEFSRDLLNSLNSQRACFCNVCTSSNS